ncbi:MAG: SMC family ATPase, partial [Candidatus Aenigmatarchaeota archaeon]
MIERVQIKNWRSHLDSTLEFSPGINVLVGPIGSGKSSVMNAICFGLFGTFPDLQSRKLKLEDLIMNKPRVMDHSEIVVDFVVDGKRYSVMRVIERNKGTTYCEIRKEDQLIDSPSSQKITEVVEKLLKINYDLFSRVVYSEQNEIDYFLRLPRGERMKKIDNLLMIDRFEKVRSGVVTLGNRIFDIKRTIKNLIDSQDLENSKKMVHELEREIENLLDEKEILFKKIVEMRENKSILEKKLEKLEKEEKNLIELKNRKN